MKSINVLILEDDLETLEIILKTLRQIENVVKVIFAVTILPDYEKTEAYINKNPQIKFDLLLLDKDCFKGGSFHVIDLSNFDLNKVIAISTTPEYNQKVLEKGARVAVAKNYSNLSEFSRKLKEEILLSVEL